MDLAALEARLAHLEQTNAELRQEIQLLRAVPEAKKDAREGELLPRRALLTGAAYTLGAVGLSLVGTRPAEALTGTMQYGTINDAGDSFTGLRATISDAVLYVSSESTSANSYALRAIARAGVAVQARVLGTSSPADAINAGRWHRLRDVCDQAKRYRPLPAWDP